MLFPSQEQPVLTREELEAALADLQATAAKLYQQNESLTAYYQAAVEESERYRAVGAIARSLRQSLDSAEILQQTVMAVRHLLQVDRVVFYQFQPSKDLQPLLGEMAEALPEQAVAIAEALQPQWRSLLGGQLDLSLAQGLTSFFVEPRVLVVEAVEQTPFVSAVAPLIEQQVKAFVAVPVLRAAQPFGVLCVHECSSYRAWKPAELESLQQISKEVALALQQSALYRQLQQLNADLEQQVEQRTQRLRTALTFESMLKRITDRVRDSLDGSQILQAAVQELTLVLNLGGCNAALYDLDQGTSTIRYEYTRSIPTCQGRVSQMDDFPEIYERLKQGQSLQFCSLLPNPARGRVAMLACPIFVDPHSSNGFDRAVLGDLWLIHQEDHIFQEFEIRLVQQVASQCAIAIRQAQLYQKAQQQVQVLEKLNQLKDDFLSTVSHELRTPITNVKMAAQMLRLTPSEAKRQRYLDILEKEATREADLIDDLLDLQRLESAVAPIELEPIDLQTWLPSLIEPFQSRFSDRQQIFQFDCPAALPTFNSNEPMLRRILAELLNNACKYTPPDGRISLTIDHSVSHISFSVCNYAHIPAEELPKLFDKFYRCPNADPWSQGGTGLGLALVQKLVEHLQGSLQVESADGWTTFRVSLPAGGKGGAF
ncbi:GAF domain-containing sensor histidine kinase [Phormidium tenue FACHB-886]|nr:GAF domain-containing sensor histidine kinase [Phormidium tenue FACHB-886]